MKGNAMEKIKSILKNALPKIVIGIASATVGIGIYATLSPTEVNTEVKVEADYSITLAEAQKPALVEGYEGQFEEISAPTVEEIDGNQVLAPEGDLPDLGQGAYYDVSTPQSFRDAAYGKCIDLDGYYGAQCVDLAAAFWQSYANRWPNVCGTGAARGLWDCREQNASDDFELITDSAALQAGDWIIFGGGQYGHVGMALGPYNDGYVALLGENQGGESCIGGGAATNIINMSTRTFLGAFRPKVYVEPEPEPARDEETPLPVSQCVQWHLLKGDTMSKIMLECENTVVYGEAMDAYAKSWYSLVYVPGQSVYDGWYKSQNGVGLYEGDDIEHRVEGEK